MDLNLLDSAARMLEENRLFQYKPYEWQTDFHNASATYSERMIMAGNQVGKTYSAGAEFAMHATGYYPDWYKGKRLEKPELMWACNKTNEDCRDISQRILLGGMGANRKPTGTGLIPKRCIGEHKIRQAGIGDVIDYVNIRWRDTDHWTKVQFKSYEQGWQKFQGRKVDVAWPDEEPDDQKIFTEIIARTTNSGGLIMVTFTPLSGRTDMVEYFTSGDHDAYLKNVTVYDAKHISSERIKEMEKKYPAHEREARMLGVPMQGEGRVFPVEQSLISCAPFEIPDYYRQVIGIDFGWDHPAATVKLAYDADNDIEYVIGAHKQRHMGDILHIDKIRSMGGDRIPVSWPHDGLNTEKGKGTQQISNYKNKGLNLLSQSARYKNDVGGGQSVEAGALELLDRMQTGRFKVFSNLTEVFEEIRNFHRKDGKIVDKFDDLIKAIFYARMMKRYAMPKMIREFQGPTGAYL